MWCPDHVEEREEHRRQAISEAARKRIDPQPVIMATKKCYNPDPQSHAPGAVFPSSAFYLRKGGKRSDGSQPLVIDSRCKQCRREEAARNRDELRKRDPERFKEIHGKRQRKYRKKVRMERKRAARESDARLPVEPFRSWLQQNMNGTPVEALAKSVGVDEALFRTLLADRKSKVSMSVVDRTGMAFGIPGLLNDLYPPQ